MNRALLENLTFAQLVEKFLSCFVTEVLKPALLFVQKMGPPDHTLSQINPV